MVSIILPNLNTPLRFLGPRIDSIKNQQYSNWECIIVDGFSDNGSWEFLSEVGKTDIRFSCYQRDRNGIYDAWNFGIIRAKGSYTYIATSDDLFSEDFLTIMTNQMDNNYDCEIAHCCLNIIDENNHLTISQWKDWDKVKFYGENINRYHKRIAPYDAIVHFGWSTVYTSSVQLLIRTSLFHKTGLFSTQYDSIADFEWGLRASLVTNVLHVPLYLASWRRHRSQATNDNLLNSPQFYDHLLQMTSSAFKEMQNHNLMTERDRISLIQNYLLIQFSISSYRQKFYYLFKNILKYPWRIILLVLGKLIRYPFPKTDAFLRKKLSMKKSNKLFINMKPANVDSTVE